MANELDKMTSRNTIPDHLRQFAKVKLGNIDASDEQVPRVKLLQALNPELTTFDNAKVGTFWHTIACENMGDKLLAIPIVIRKSFVLWAPRNDDRQILARAMDGIHWDQPGAEFTVKPKGAANPVTYHLADTVAESGLAEFGSSIPGDPQSVPAASLTYNMLWYFVEWPELSPAIIINTRSAIKPVKELISKINSKPVAHYAQLYDIGIVQQKGAEGPFYNFTYTGAGFEQDVDIAKRCEEMYKRYADSRWYASDEAADTPEDSRPERPSKTFNERMASKF
jgi:hypothetical protein